MTIEFRHYAGLTARPYASLANWHSVDHASQRYTDSANTSQSRNFDTMPVDKVIFNEDKDHNVIYWTKKQSYYVIKLTVDKPKQ